MNCRKAQKLISPYLDGALKRREEAALTEHLARCATCAGEFALQERISMALREIGREEVPAPPELCSLVMGRLKSSPLSRPARWLPVVWKRTVATAAAVLVIAGSSAWLAVSFKSSDLKTAGPAAPMPVEVAAGESATGAERNLTGGQNALVPTKEVSGQTSAAAGQSAIGGVINNTSISGAIAIASEDTNRTGATPGREVAPPETASVASAALTQQRTLLDSDLKVTSTVLKVAVSDLAEAEARASALAYADSASVQVFPGKGNGKKVVVVRAVVQPQRAQDLINGFTSLGALFDRQDERRDLTALYNETLVQYNELLSRIAHAGDAAERQRLEAQAASYRRQLEAWEAEAGKYVIVLWLEGR